MASKKLLQVGSGELLTVESINQLKGQRKVVAFVFAQFLQQMLLLELESFEVWFLALQE